MYVDNRQLGFSPAAIPVAAKVAKNAFRFFSRLFGGKLVFGLKESEFKQRHTNAHWFRALWLGRYWFREGAGELPPGMSAQDYYVNRFKVVPFIPHHSNIQRFRKRGIPFSSLRLTAIPGGMRWPPDIASIPLDAIQRVLPVGYRWDAQKLRPIAPAGVTLPGEYEPAKTMPSGQYVSAGFPTAALAAPSISTPMLLVGAGLFLMWIIKE